MTHHIFITKTGVTIAATGLLNLGAMIAREDISTYLQFGTMLGLIYLGFVSAKTAKTTNQIHVLSNSNMEAQLRIVMLQAKRISEMTKAKPSAVTLAICDMFEDGIRRAAAAQQKIKNFRDLKED